MNPAIEWLESSEGMAAIAFPNPELVEVSGSARLGEDWYDTPLPESEDINFKWLYG